MSMNDASNLVTRTGVIGLGAMGLQMARHLVGKGFEVVGFDVDVDAMKRALGHGVKSCLSPAQVGAHAEVVIVMVANDQQVEDAVARSGLMLRGLEEWPGKDTKVPGHLVLAAEKRDA